MGTEGQDEGAYRLVAELLRAAAVLRGEVARALEADGLTPEDWPVLEALWKQDGLTQGQLVGELWRDRAAVWRSVEGLVAKGLVEKRGDEGDRRQQRAWLTRKGRRIEERVRGHLFAAAQLARDLKPEGREALAEVIATMRERVLDW